MRLLFSLRLLSIFVPNIEPVSYVLVWHIGLFGYPKAGGKGLGVRQVQAAFWILATFAIGFGILHVCSRLTFSPFF